MAGFSRADGGGALLLGFTSLRRAFYDVEVALDGVQSSMTARCRREGVTVRAGEILELEPLRTVESHLTPRGRDAHELVLEHHVLDLAVHPRLPEQEPGRLDEANPLLAPQHPGSRRSLEDPAVDPTEARKRRADLAVELDLRPITMRGNCGSSILPVVTDARLAANRCCWCRSRDPVDPGRPERRREQVLRVVEQRFVDGFELGGVAAAPEIEGGEFLEGLHG